MKIFKSLLGVILACIFYVVIFTLIFVVFKLLRLAEVWAWVQGGNFYRTLLTILLDRNAPPSPSEFFHNLLASGIGAYLALAGVNKIFSDYNKKIVFYCFSAALMLFTVHALTLMIPAAKDVGFGWYDFSIQILTPIVAIGAAFFAIFIRKD